MSKPDQEKEALLNDTEYINSHSRADTHVYKRRWWILFVFCACVISQALFFNTWGPITQSAEAYFGWSDGIIGLLANWSSISIIISMFPMSYIMSTKGLRFSTLLCITLTFVGSGLRCITRDPSIATWLINLGHILNGIAGTALIAGPSLLAVTWFPTQQRATATALAIISFATGMALSFVLGPLVVSTPKHETIFNMSLISNESNISFLVSNLSASNYSECGLAAICFFAVLFYFPKNPPKPPSKSASLDRIDFKKAFKGILSNRSLWLLTFGFTLPNGVFTNWGTVIDVILIPVGINQTQIGNIAAVATVSGCVSAVLIARFSDIFMKRMKIILVSLYIIAIGAFTWFILLVHDIIEFNIESLWVASILGTMALQGTNPLFFELACETAYPVAEGIAGGLLTLFNNISGGIFLLVLLIPNIGTEWMNYCLVGGIGAGLTILLFFKENYSRMDIDITVPEPYEKPVHMKQNM